MITRSDEDFNSTNKAVAVLVYISTMRDNTLRET